MAEKFSAQSNPSAFADNSKDKNLILGECKYWAEPVGMRVLRDLEAKTASVAWVRASRIDLASRGTDANNYPLTQALPGNPYGFPGLFLLCSTGIWRSKPIDKRIRNPYNKCIQE